MKRCSDCGERKPLKDYHKNKSCKNGRLPVCKSCRSLQYYSKLNYIYCDSCGMRVKEKDAVSPCSYCSRPKKVCDNCGELKLLSKFYQNRGAADGRQSNCILCQVRSKGEVIREFTPNIPREMVAAMYRKKYK